MDEDKQMRTQFTLLTSDNLLAVARNSAAAHRLLAIEMLVERASPLACHSEIVAEAQQFVLSNPLVLKRIDPAAAMAATKLPGIVDCVANVQSLNQSLSQTVAENHSALTQRASGIEQTVTTNKKAHATALSEMATTASQEKNQLKENLEKQISDLREAHNKESSRLSGEIEAAENRLALLERSVFRKFADWVKGLFS